MQSFFVAQCGGECRREENGGIPLSQKKTQSHTVEESSSGFRKEISLFGGVSIIGGIMIGSGIFYLGSYVLQRSEMSMGLSLLVWILGGLISLMGGLCYAELGAAMPKAGGSYVYLSRAYHPAVGFMSGFSSWLLGGAGSIAAIAIAFPKAFSSVIPMSDTTVKVVAVVLILLLTAVNYVGVKSGSLVQNIFMVAKVAPILLILVLGLFVGRQSIDWNPIPASNPSFGGLIGMIAFATVASLWAYEGWTNLNTVSEEIRNPKKNIPLALIIAIIGCTLLFTLFNLAIYRVLPAGEISAMIQNGDIYLGTEVANRVLGSAGQIIVIAAMATAIFGSLNGCILVFPRQYYAMAKDGYFFKSFAKLHPKYKTPATALWVQAGSADESGRIFQYVFQYADHWFCLYLPQARPGDGTALQGLGVSGDSGHHPADLHWPADQYADGRSGHIGDRPGGAGCRLRLLPLLPVVQQPPTRKISRSAAQP